MVCWFNSPKKNNPIITCGIFDRINMIFNPVNLARPSRYRDGFGRYDSFIYADLA
jgi:hypothetical protein